MFGDKWRSDLNITLAALESISCMANYDCRFIGESATFYWKKLLPKFKFGDCKK